jgi:hypothetical protein
MPVVASSTTGRLTRTASTVMARTSPAMTVKVTPKANRASDPRAKLGGMRTISIALHSGMEIASRRSQ